MSVDEFEGWIGFDQIDPIGAFRADLNAATIAQTIANCNRGKNQRPYKRTDFMPFYEAPKATNEEIGDAFLVWGRQMKARLEQKKRRASKRRQRAH
jgi:hypothetical protein